MCPSSLHHSERADGRTTHPGTTARRSRTVLVRGRHSYYPRPHEAIDCYPWPLSHSRRQPPEYGRARVASCPGWSCNTTHRSTHLTNSCPILGIGPDQRRNTIKPPMGSSDMAPSSPCIVNNHLHHLHAPSFQCYRKTVTTPFPGSVPDSPTSSDVL